MVILKDDRLIFINRMLTELLGYRAEKLLGMSFDELSRRTIHPDDRPWVLQRLRDRLGGQPAPARYELRVIRKDGTIRWLEQFVGHISYDGEAMALRNLIPWKRSEGNLPVRREDRVDNPLYGLQREMNRVFSDFFSYRIGKGPLLMGKRPGRTAGPGCQR